MDLRELWIGDSVRIISTGQIGKFEGIAADNHGRIKTSKKILLIPAMDLEVYTESVPKFDISELEEETSTAVLEDKWSDELDLHIEKLRPDLAQALPQMILNFQIETAKNYIQKAIHNYRAQVKIIHGKGTGQLKEEIYHLLRSNKEVLHTVPANDGGAVDVWFKY